MIVFKIIFVLSIYIGLQTLCVYVLYSMSISKIVNIRLTRLKCLYAEKELRYNNLLEKKENLKDKLLNGYADRDTSLPKTDKLREKEKRCTQLLDDINKQLNNITREIEQLNRYKKD